MLSEQVIDVVLYVVAIIGFAVVYRENKKLQKELESKTSKYNDLQKRNKQLETRCEELEKVDTKQRYDIKNLRAFKTEAARLRLLVQKIKDSYTQGDLSSLQNSTNVKTELDTLLKEEVKLLKEQEKILKQEETSLLKDNKLLESENNELSKQIQILKQQIINLKSTNKEIPKYLKEIEDLKKEIETTISNHTK